MTTIQISSPDISTRQSGDEVIWDATLRINKITPKDEKIRWTKAKIAVKSSDGSVLNERSNLDRYDPSASAGGGISITDVQFWFEDSDHDGKISAGDNFMITGMNAVQYGGALVQILFDGKVIGDTMLPTDLS